MNQQPHGYHHFPGIHAGHPGHPSSIIQMTPQPPNRPSMPPNQPATSIPSSIPNDVIPNQVQIENSMNNTMPKVPQQSQPIQQTQPMVVPAQTQPIPSRQKKAAILTDPNTLLPVDINELAQKPFEHTVTSNQLPTSHKHVDNQTEVKTANKPQIPPVNRQPEDQQIKVEVSS